MNVPAPPEDDRKLPENSPDADLNPMTNTLLAQNMGRWAEVYFTTPPEKRDEAVQELLRELKTGERGPRQTPTEAPITATEEEILNAKAKLLELEKQKAQPNTSRNAAVTAPALIEPSAPEDLVCPACLSKNKAHQRFCGLCGLSLITGRDAEHQPQAPPPSSSSAAAEPMREGNDWSWLHERNLSELGHPQGEGGAWKYVLVLLLLLAACIAGYLWWRNNVRSNGVSGMSSSAVVQRETENQTSSTAEGKNSRSELSRVPDRSQTKATEPHHDTSGTPVSTPPRSQPASSSNSTPAHAQGSVAEQGVQELEKGRDYLEGRGVPKDSTLAAKWLWKSVAKQNTEATVILSQLYVSGNGVPKSCDQARLLLSAVAEKGSDGASQQLKDVVARCR
jgi:hypothetical protein